MNKLPRNQIVAIVLFGVVLLVGAIIILSSGGGEKEVEVTDIPTAVAQAATEEPTLEPSTTATAARRDDEQPAPVDSDGDGFTDDVDACVTEGNVNGTGVDGSGCPNPPPPPPPADSDGDGVNDDADACPSLGDINGTGIDGSGCPNLPALVDSDGDGFTDDVDACPGQGDINGTGIDGSGCPNPALGNIEVVQPTLIIDAANAVSAGSGAFDFSASATASDGSAIFYSWSFGDGNSASGNPVQYTYPYPGDTPADYTVTLNVVAGEMTAATTLNVQVLQDMFPGLNEVQFIASATNLDAIFDDTSNNSVNYTREWFVDGASVGSGDPQSYSFASAGTYTIRLVLTDEYGRTLETSQQIIVSEGQAVDVSCTPNLTQINDTLPISVQFDVTGENIESYAWDFGGGDVETSTSFIREYGSAVTVSGTLTCTPTAGLGVDPIVLPFSITIVEQTVDLGAIFVNFSIDPASGTAPFTFSIINTSSTTLTGETLTYEWTVSLRGGGESYTSTDANPTFTLNTVGIYDIFVTVTGDLADADAGTNRTATGSGAVSVVDALAELIPDFTITRVQELTESLPFIFDVVDNSDQVNGGTIETWDWTVVTPGAQTLTFSGAGPHRVESSEEGQYVITMNVTGAGGQTTGQVIKSTSVLLGGTVTASFEVESTTELEGGAGYQVCFRNTSLNYETAEWDFDFANPGVSTSSDTAEVVCTIYATANTYRVLLTTTGQGGDATAEYARFVGVAQGEEPPVANYNASTTNMEPGGTVYLTNTSTGNVESWEWTLFNVDTSAVVASDSGNYNTSFTIQEPGTYSVRLYVENSGGNSVKDDIQIVVTYGALSCTLKGDNSVYPGQSVNYSVQSSRGLTTYAWSVVDASGNVVTSGTSSTIRVTWPDGSGVYTVHLDGSTDDGASCSVDRSVTLERPALACTISGKGSAYPGQNMTFTINFSNDVKNSYSNIAYTWTLGGDFTVVSGGLDQKSITVNWPEAGSFGLMGQISAAGVEPVACSVGFEAVTIQYGNLSCPNPSGTTSPLANQMVQYSVNPGNTQGRTVVIEWRLIDRSDNSVVVDWTAGNTFAYTFATPGQQLQLQYRVTVDGETEPSCTKSRNINVGEETVVCNGFTRGEWTPAYATSNYSYEYSVNRGSTSVTHIWTMTVNGQTIDLGSFNNNSTLNVNAGAWAGAVSAIHDTGTLSVRVVDASDASIVYCEGSHDVVFGKLDVNFNVDVTEIQPGGQVCVTNMSSTSYGQIGSILENVVWHWNFDNGNRGEVTPETSDQYQPGCITYTTPGEYTIRLQGDAFGGGEDMSGNKSVTIRVVANDAINVTATPNSAEGNVTISFHADLTNVTESTLVWDIDGVVFNRQGSANVTRFFPSVTETTQYTITATGEGAVRQVSASVVVTIFPEGGLLSANFSASAYGVAAGTQVCFYDQSTSSGPAITNWVWDLGNGTTFSFDQSSYQGTVCTTYVEANQTYTARLTVTNETDLSVNASNTIRTFSDFESRNSYVPAYYPGYVVCFAAQLESGVVVTGWNYGGAGNVVSPPAGVSADTCYQYNEAGTYTVSMQIESGGVTGNIPRVVTVGSGQGEQNPYVDLSASCQADGSILATVYNSGGDMDEDESGSIVITGRVGQQSQILSDTFNLGRGENAQFSVGVNDIPNTGIIITVTFRDQTLTRSFETSCWDRSSLTVSGQCVDNIPSFTVTNAGDGNMQGGTTWELYELLPDNTLGQLIDSGTTNAIASGQSQTFDFPGLDYQNLKFIAYQRAGHQGSSIPQSEVYNCGGEPELSLQAVCSEAGVATFTVNNSGGAMTVAVTPEVTAQYGTPVLEPTSLLLGAGDFTSFTATGGYGIVTFSVAEFEASIDTNCAIPQISPILECVEQTENGYVAHFGYSASDNFSLPAGSPGNSFSPEPADRGQPSDFVSGRTPYYPNAAFQVPFDGNNLVWTLFGRTATASSGGNPCGYHILFDKEWLIAETSVDAPELSEGFSITANSSMGSTATCTWGNGQLTCQYSNPGNVVDQRGLLVTPDGSYTVSENNAPEGWTASGLGTFGPQNENLECGVFGLDKFCTHTIINEGTPDYEVGGFCGEDNGDFYFDASYSFDYQPTPTYQVVSNTGEVVASGTIDELLGGILLTSNAASLTLTINGAPVSISPVTVAECYVAPQIKAAGECVDGNGNFRVSIVSLGGTPIGDTSISYEVVDNNGNALDSGTISYNDLPFIRDYAQLNVLSVTLNITSVSDNLHIAQGDNSYTVRDCYAPPQVNLSGICGVENGSFYFNASFLGGTPFGNYTYEIVDEGGAVVQSGNLSDIVGGITLSGDYASLTLSASSDSEADATPVPVTVGNCYIAPDLKVSVYCSEADDAPNGSYVVSVDNRGGALLSGQAISLVVTGDGNELFNGGISVPFTQNFAPYQEVSATASIDGTSYSATATSDSCYVEPVIAAGGYCSNENGGFNVTISAGNDDLPIGDATISYSITGSDGSTLKSGTLDYSDLPFTYTHTDSALQWIEISIDGFTGGSISQTVYRTENCYHAPSINLNGSCADGNGDYYFVGTMSGTPLGDFTYTITDGDGNSVQSGSFSDLLTGILINGKYGQLTVTVPNNGVDTTAEVSRMVAECYEAPDLNLQVYCVRGADNGTFGVQASNQGGVPIDGADALTLLVTANSGTVTLYDGTLAGFTSPTNFAQYFDVYAELSYSAEEISVSANSDECYAVPEYVGSGICEAQGIFVFSVSATGGMPITGNTANVVVIGTDYYSGAETQLYSGPYDGLPTQFEGSYSVVTMTISTEEGTVIQALPLDTCFTAPELVASGVCLNNNGQFEFVVNNVGGAFLSDTPDVSYSVADQDNNDVAGYSGTLGYGTTFPAVIDITGEYDALKLMFTGSADAVIAATTPDCFTEPEFVPAVICSETNGQFNLSVANVGGVLVDTIPSYQIFLDGEGQGVVAMPTGVMSATETGRYANVAIEVYFGGEEAIARADNSECYVLPEIEADVMCMGEDESFQNGSFYVYVANNGGTPVILDGESLSLTVDTVDMRDGTTGSNTFSLPAVTGQLYESFFTGPYSLVTATVNVPGFNPLSVDNSECYSLPEYTPEGVCVEGSNGTFQFNTAIAGGAPVTGDVPTYSIFVSQGDGVNNVVYPLVQDESLFNNNPVTVTGRYASVTYILSTTEGIVEPISVTLDNCYEVPVYVPDVLCLDNGTFAVSIVNNGGQPVGGLPSGYIDFAVVNGGGASILLLEDLSLPYYQEFVGPYQYVSVSIGSPGVESVTATNDGCYTLPNYQPEMVCVEGSNGTFQYGFFDSVQGRTPVANEPMPQWFLRDDATGDILASGQGAPFTAQIAGQYSSLTFGVQTGQLFYGAIFSDVPYFDYATTTNESCYVPPVYEPEAVCYPNNGEFHFAVSNTGGTPLGELPTYIITDQDGNTIEQGQITGLPFEITVRGPYESVKLTLTTSEGSVTREATTLDGCYEPPAFGGNLICYGQDGAFLVSIGNMGGQPLPGTDLPAYSVTNNATGEVIAQGVVDALPFALNVVAPVKNATLTLTLPSGNVLSDDALDCYGTETPEPTPEPTPEVTPTPTPEVCGQTVIGEDGYPIIDMNPAACGDTEGELVDWTPIEVGESICPDWFVYHTDITGDWEIFRLGTLPDGLTGDENLTHGVDAIDLAPSRASDGLWVAFASNRDGDWDIWVARADDPMGTLRQITLNSNAIDLDPVWSPDGTKIAYESTVDGNWEIRVVDVVTGEKFFVTDNPANDINPFWSSDSDTLIFQSDRFVTDAGERLWQLYTVSLSDSSFTAARVEGQPEADNHDPQYSFDDSVIAFRSYADDPDGRQGAVYVLVEQEDGSFALQLVSDLGGDARNEAISPDGRYVAYQSNLNNGINDIFVYDIETGETRQITSNEGDRYIGVQDTAPTWFCNSTTLIFTSNVETPSTTPNTVGGLNDNNIYSVEALPMDAPAIQVDNEAARLTEDDSNDRDPENTPSEENASRNGQLPPKLDPSVDTR